MIKGTLIIGSTFSVCGDCGRNANWEEKGHHTEPPRDIGCGVEWRYVTNDRGASAGAVQKMRPDLEYHPMDQELSGVTEAVEARVIHRALSPDASLN